MRRNGPLWSHRLLRQTTTTGATGRANQAPAVTTHVLTAYHLRSAREDKLPPLRVTPLSLTDDDGKECVQALWSAVRLLREGRVSNASSLANPFDEDGNARVELFAQAGARDVGEVLRCGKAILSARELAVKALGYQSTREVVEKAEFDLTSSSADDESRLAYSEILREALYMHALGSMSELFDVSRDGRTSILLTAKLVAGSWAATRVSDAVVVLDQYTLSVDVTSEKDAELKCSLGHELRSPLTVRQILDDPALMDLPEGSEVVALGGPHLQGQLSYTKIGDKKIGDAREELKGESLLSYHRKRYDARVPLLENARDDDDAVQLVQPGRPPTPYPAELLSPVIKMNILDSDTRDAVSDACSGSPGDLQRRVSGIRAMLGQPFSPLLHLDEKMRRLTSATPAFPNNLAQTRAGDLTTGPAAMDFNDSTSKSPSSSQLVLMLGKSSSVQPERVGQYLERLADGASAVMTDWGSATDAQIRRVKSDIQDASVVFYDDASFDAARQSIFKAFRPGNKDQRPRVVLFPLSADRAFVEASVRRASSQIPSVNARWAADPSSYARFCVALVASQYGAQATTCKEAIAPEGTRFVGAGVKSGLPVVDEKGRVIARQNGAPVGASLATAVRNAIDLGLKRVIIHHAGRSDDGDIAAALALADSNGIDILAVVDILEHDFGRVLGWSKDAGRVVQPARGFWAILDQEDEAILVTTGMDSNLARPGITRPLHLSKRFGALPLSDCVAQAYRLAEVDRYYAKTSFRMPVTLRHVDDGGVDRVDVILLPPPL